VFSVVTAISSITGQEADGVLSVEVGSLVCEMQARQRVICSAAC
jgi:hypothetical protein